MPLTNRSIIGPRARLPPSRVPRFEERQSRGTARQIEEEPPKRDHKRRPGGRTRPHLLWNRAGKLAGKRLDGRPLEQRQMSPESPIVGKKKRIGRTDKLTGRRGQLGNGRRNTKTKLTQTSPKCTKTISHALPPHRPRSTSVSLIA